MPYMVVLSFLLAAGLKGNYIRSSKNLMSELDLSNKMLSHLPPRSQTKVTRCPRGEKEREKKDNGLFQIIDR